MFPRSLADTLCKAAQCKTPASYCTVAPFTDIQTFPSLGLGLGRGHSDLGYANILETYPIGILRDIGLETRSSHLTVT